MSRTFKFGMAGVLVAGVLAVLFVAGSAMAQATPTADTAPMMQRGGFGGGMCGQAGEEAAAKALGLTTDEMSAELWGGRTLADLADRAGVDLQTVQDAVQNACKDQVRVAVEQAVTDGSLTREKADWLLQGLDKGFWGTPGEGPGFGGFMGKGFGRGAGFGGFDGPMGFGGRGMGRGSDDFGGWGGPGNRGQGQGFGPGGGMRGPGAGAMCDCSGQPNAQAPNAPPPTQ